MKIKVFMSVVLTLFIFAVTGCTGNKIDANEIHQKNAFITKLTRKAQLAVRKNITDPKDISAYVNGKFPQIMSNFDDYSIIFKNDSKNAVVLMCDKEKKKAYVEDIVCTAAVDAPKLYEKDLPCDFQLDIKEYCK